MLKEEWELGIYSIDSSNTAYFEQAQKSALQEDPLYYENIV